MERAGWAALSPALRGSLESAGRDRNVLRVKERDFSVGDLSWGRGGTLGRDTSLYKAMQQVCRSTTEQGFLCYEEMFIWANELLDIYPRIADALRYRFPLLFVDEVQDNSKAQSALLHRTCLVWRAAGSVVTFSSAAAGSATLSGCGFTSPGAVCCASPTLRAICNAATNSLAVILHHTATFSWLAVGACGRNNIALDFPQRGFGRARHARRRPRQHQRMDHLSRPGGGTGGD